MQSIAVYHVALHQNATVSLLEFDSRSIEQDQLKLFKITHLNIRSVKNKTVEVRELIEQETLVRTSRR